MCNALSDSARKDKVLQTPDSLFRYLIERVRSNLHVVLCMSPVGELFRWVLALRPTSFTISDDKNFRLTRPEHDS